MQVLPALEVKSRFGRVSNIVKSGELVTITQHGEPTMVLFPLKLAKEVLKAYRTLGKSSSQQDEGEGLLEWLEARTPQPSAENPTPVFDEQTEKQKIREMVAKKLGIPTPPLTTREAAITAFDRWMNDKSQPVDPEVANMTDDEYEAMVAQEIKAARAEKRAEEAALVDSH